MEKEKVVLQVILHEDGGLEIRVPETQSINALMLVGVLEQVKMGILSGEPMVQQPSRTQYDA